MANGLAIGVTVVAIGVGGFLFFNNQRQGEEFRAAENKFRAAETQFRQLSDAADRALQNEKEGQAECDLVVDNANDFLQVMDKVGELVYSSPADLSPSIAAGISQGLAQRASIVSGYTVSHAPSAFQGQVRAYASALDGLSAVENDRKQTAESFISRMNQSNDADKVLLGLSWTVKADDFNKTIRTKKDAAEAAARNLSRSGNSAKQELYDIAEAALQSEKAFEPQYRTALAEYQKVGGKPTPLPSHNS